MKLSPTWLVIAALVLYILYLTQCRQTRPCTSTTIPLVDTQAIVEKFTIGWTRPRPDTVYRPRIITKEVPGRPPVPVFIEVVKDREVPIYIKPTRGDTLAILEDYFARVNYTDSIKTRYGMIWVHDVISRNRIEQRKWDVELATPVVRTRPWSIYGGGGGYTAPGEFISAVHFDLGYVNRRGQSFEFNGMLQGRHWHKGFTFHHTIYSSK